jgi:hypothetical protein
MTKSIKKETQSANRKFKSNSNDPALSLPSGMPFDEKDEETTRIEKDDSFCTSLSVVNSFQIHTLKFSCSNRHYTTQEKHAVWNLQAIDQSNYAIRFDSSIKIHHSPASGIFFENLINTINHFDEDCEELDESDDCISVDSIDLSKKRMKQSCRER